MDFEFRSNHKKRLKFCTYQVACSGNAQGKRVLKDLQKTAGSAWWSNYLSLDWLGNNQKGSVPELALSNHYQLLASFCQCPIVVVVVSRSFYSPWSKGNCTFYIWLYYYWSLYSIVSTIVTSSGWIKESLYSALLAWSCLRFVGSPEKLPIL